MNFANRSKHIESECKAYTYRAGEVRRVKHLSAAIADVERFPVGSPEWKEAVKRNAAILSDQPGTF